MKVLIIILSFIPLNGFSQRWQDTNRGLYPQSIQTTYNARNTAFGFRYSYLFNKPIMEMPLGCYASFSNTISSNINYNNYKWERKLSIGGIIQLPYDLEAHGTHSFFTLGLVYNLHPKANTNKNLMPGQYDSSLYYTSMFGCDIGIEQQYNRFRWHLTVDVINFMRYVEFGFGYCYFRIRR